MFNKDGSLFKICTECSPNHIENCTTCFGFGLKKHPNGNEDVPITAGAAMRGSPPEWRQCPECLSTPDGIDPEVYEVYNKCGRA